MRSYAMRVWLAAVLTGAGITFGMAADLSTLDIPACDKPPKLDGKIDDPAWQQAAKIDNLYLMNSNTPAQDTTFRLMHDNAWLYIAANCRNPQMSHVSQLAREHDSSVSMDDSLEFFIRPTADENAPYYHFMLNFANVGKEQRCNKAGLRESEWDPAWRTVTHRQADGWTAEISIPLYVLGTNDLGGMQMNLCRNLTTIELDAQGVKKKETRAGHTLLPGSKGSYHDPANFRAVSGLGGFKPESSIFVPQIVAAFVTGVRQESGKKFYDLKVLMDIATPATGTAVFKVVEDFGKGEVEALSQSVDLKGLMDLEVKIPAGDLQARQVKTALLNPADGSLLAERMLIQTDLARDVISKDKHPFFKGKAAPTARSSTYVVAAADSPKHLKEQADFICEGRDDNIVITAAIAALPATGGSVHLAAGTYSIGSVEGAHGGIVIFRNNVLLTGEGSGTRLVLQDGLSAINVIWIKENIRDITVRDLFINGNGKKQAPWSDWSGGSGVKAIRGINVKVENCRIENCQVMAVMLAGSCVEVLDCYFTGDFGSHVIEILGHSGRIDGCTLQVKDGDSAGYGFSTDACFQYNIINNKIFVDAGGTICSHPINNWPSKRFCGPAETNLFQGIIAGNIVVNNGKTGPVLIDGYMDMVNNNIFRGVPVVIGGPDGGMGVAFENNMVINGSLEINSPFTGNECLIFINGNSFFNSSVKHKNGNVVWGTNPGYVPEKK